MAQFSGTVRWFNNAKGYGFLSTETGSDVFDPVQFDVTEGKKELQADKVTEPEE